MMTQNRIHSPAKAGTLLATLLCAVSLPSAHAAPLDFQFTSEVSQDAYDDLVQPLVGATRFAFVHPASPTGPLGFDLGVAVTGAELPEESKTAATTYLADGGDFPDFVALPRLTAMKGLPFGFDLAVNLAMIPSTDILIIGGALQWAIVDMAFPVPVLSVRVGHSQLLGLDSLVAQSTNAELVASLGIPPGVNIITPYGGLGVSWHAAESSYDYTNPILASTPSAKVTSNWQDVYGLLGLRVAIMPFIAISAELQASETQSLYSAKLSFGF